MKTKITSKIFMIAMATLLVACEKDFLEQNPKLSQTDEEALSTYDRLVNATAGAYYLLCSQYWYGNEFVLDPDIKGGNAKRGPINTGRFVNEYLWNNTPNFTSFLWTDAYATIASANNIINTIDGGFAEAGVAQSQLDQLKGECLFLRALAHWDMTRIYCQPYVAGTSNMGVPVILKTEKNYPARNTVGEVYEQVVTDLTEAISLLPVTNSRGVDNAWANKWVAKALLSKVYMYMGQWQLSADMATDVIDNGPFSLFTAAQYTTWDQNGYWGSGGSGSEIIFQVDGSQGNSARGGNFLWEVVSYLTSPDGYGDIVASQDLLSLFEAGDVRADLFVIPTKYPTTSWSLKYTGRLGSAPPLDFNVPVLRLSEMHLIRAEALLNGATISGITALMDYNMLRTHRGLAPSSSNPVLDDIYKERRRELCFEGNELFDLARTQRSLVRTDYNGSMRKDVPFVVGGTASVNYLWAMPIPQSECDANINMVQNPEY